jgi:hypothetical protein
MLVGGALCLVLTLAPLAGASRAQTSSRSGGSAQAPPALPPPAGPPPAAPPSAGWEITSKDGTASIKLGFLAQGQAEWLETASGQDVAANLFLRRFRILFGGRISDRWSFFFETDSPNVGKANASGVKDASDIFIQDVYLTYSWSDALKMDAGMLLFPLSRQHGQSAALLLALDYAPYAFVESGPTGERVGRDYGAQLRGYPFRRKFEYRVAVLQGVRGPEGDNPFRVAARAAWYPFGTDMGYFYGGTYLGRRRFISLGGSLDRQKDYHVYSVDAFYEQPLGEGRGVTLQGGWTHFDGAQSIRVLPEQNTWFVEAGAHLGLNLTPFVQYASRRFTSEGVPGEDYVQAGLAWWMKGHQRNLKAGVGRFAGDEAVPTRTQFVVQLQIFYY